MWPTFVFSELSIVLATDRPDEGHNIILAIFLIAVTGENKYLVN